MKQISENQFLVGSGLERRNTGLQSLGHLQLLTLTGLMSSSSLPDSFVSTTSITRWTLLDVSFPKLFSNAPVELRHVVQNHVMLPVIGRSLRSEDSSIPSEILHDWTNTQGKSTEDLLRYILILCLSVYSVKLGQLIRASTFKHSRSKRQQITQPSLFGNRFF